MEIKIVSPEVYMSGAITQSIFSDRLALLVNATKSVLVDTGCKILQIPVSCSFAIPEAFQGHIEAVDKSFFANGDQFEPHVTRLSSDVCGMVDCVARHESGYMVYISENIAALLKPGSMFTEAVIISAKTIDTEYTTLTSHKRRLEPFL